MPTTWLVTSPQFHACDFLSIWSESPSLDFFLEFLSFSITNSSITSYFLLIGYQIFIDRSCLYSVHKRLSLQWGALEIITQSLVPASFSKLLSAMV